MIFYTIIHSNCAFFIKIELETKIKQIQWYTNIWKKDNNSIFYFVIQLIDLINY